MGGNDTVTRRAMMHSIKLLRLAVALSALSFVQMGRASELSDSAAALGATAAPRTNIRSTTHAPLERRVEALSKALDLTAGQRSQLLNILEAQRVSVAKIWSDSTLLPAERAPATRAIEEHTADQIRAILSDQQKQRYNPKRPQSVQAPAPDVSKWIELTRNSNEGGSK
jgi:DNA-binding IclR family transcriptional regulator